MTKKKAVLADPTQLEPFDSTDKQMLRVVIETPKGSRNKFAFNPDEHIFEVSITTRSICLSVESNGSSCVGSARTAFFFVNRPPRSAHRGCPHSKEGCCRY